MLYGGEIIRLFYVLTSDQRNMLITNLLFYFVVALTGVTSIVTGIRSLRTGEFYGHQEQIASWKYRAEVLITLFGGIYLILMDIWFLWH